MNTKEVGAAVNEERSSALMTAGKVGVLAAGGYILWANRFKIQRFLESQGIPTPWMTGTLGEAVASGVSKVAGSLQNEAPQFLSALDAKNVVHN